MLRIVVPARLGSTRLPDKMIQRIGSKMLVEHSLARVVEAAGDREVVLATDSDIIVGAAFGKCAALRTSANCRSGTDRCAEVAQILQWADDDIVVNVQADMPFLSPQQLAGFFKAAERGGTWDVMTAVFDQRYVAVRITGFERAVAPTHIGLYAYNCAALKRFAMLPTSDGERLHSLEQCRAAENGFKFAYHAFPEMPLEVNTAADLAAMQRMVECLA